MEKLWSVTEIMARYGWGNERVAQQKIRAGMRHIGIGMHMKVPESALAEWEEEQAQEAQKNAGKKQKKQPKRAGLRVITGGAQQGKHIVPRTREEALKQLGYG